MRLPAGVSYARWSTEAISALEFSQYEHYMQPRIHTIMSQIGYCGLDLEPEHGAQPGAPVNGSPSLDSFVYCKGYVAWDVAAIILQVIQCQDHLACNAIGRHRCVFDQFV